MVWLIVFFALLLAVSAAGMVLLNLPFTDGEEYSDFEEPEPDNRKGAPGDYEVKIDRRPKY